MTFHSRASSNDTFRLAVTDGAEASLARPPVAQFDATKFQANSNEYAALKGNQSVDSKVLPHISIFDSAHEHGSPALMARAQSGDGHQSVFGKIADKAKDIGGKAGDVAKKAGEKTGDLAKKGTGNDKPYTAGNLVGAAEKALGKHDPATRKAIHDTLDKMSDADKRKLFADLQKYNTSVELAKQGTKVGGILGGGPLGGVIASKSSGEVGKAIPEPDSMKNFKKKVNEKLHH